MKFAPVKKFFRRSKKSGSESKPPKKTPQQIYEDHERERYHQANPRPQQQFNPALLSGRFANWLRLPDPILDKVFTFVCPHSTDETYETCESSTFDNTCMMCDLRDIAQAGMVCKAWRKVAIPRMYHSIRIDSVHYCELEIDLSEKRRRRKSKSHRHGHGGSADPAAERLELLCRTLRDDPTRLGKLVEYFKTPYMLRESSASALARTIAVLPNLKYVDLPEGLFMDDHAYHTLRLEVQARCPSLLKMTYLAGSEGSLAKLGHGGVWPKLEVLELTRINMDPNLLRQVLASLSHLRALKASDCELLNDDMFQYNNVLPAFPPLEELVLADIPRITGDGLVEYLSRKETRDSLKLLSLTNTGVHPAALHNVLANAPSLITVSITEQVDSPFPASGVPIPPLESKALKSLRWEITPASSKKPSYVSTTTGYYNYLATSLFAGGLPSLAAIYVRDQNFPDMLVGLPPPNPNFAGGSLQRPSSAGSAGMYSGGLSPPGQRSVSNQQPRLSSNNPFRPPGAGVLALNQTLEIFTKGDDDIVWGSTRVDPLDAPVGGGGGQGRHGRTASSASNRPLSSYGLSGMGDNWGAAGGAWMSRIQGDGRGGFLSVPAEGAGGHARNKSSTSSFGGVRDEWPRPSSSHGPKRGDRDLWR